MRVDDERKGWGEYFSKQNEGSCTVEFRGKKSLLENPASELFVYGGKKKK